MTSLLSFYTFSGKFIDQLLDKVTIIKKLDGLDTGTLVLANSNPKLTEDLILPGNFVVVEDDNLTNTWVGVISPPTASNTTQTTIALLDPKNLLIGVPILSTAGLSLGTISVMGIEFALSAAKGTSWEHIFSFNPDENGFTFGNSPLTKNALVQLGKDIYTFLDELAHSKHFEWWIEPRVSSKGVLSLAVRAEDIRKSIGYPIYIPKHGAETGIGLAYPEKYYTALVVMDTWEGFPIFKEYMEFPGLVEKFGTYVKVVSSQDLSKQSRGRGALFKELRPRRNIQLQLHTTNSNIVTSLEIGSIHTVSLGNISFTGNTRGTTLTMRCTALTYSSGENHIGVVMEEFFETDELSLLSL